MKREIAVFLIITMVLSLSACGKTLKGTDGLIEKAREEIGINTVALSGGVYQNKLLLDYSVTMLEERGFHVLRHHLLPPNDGGISLGQAVAAMRSLQKGE